MEDARIRAAITRLKRGEIDGLAELVREYQVKAVRTAYLITSDRALAEDIVQGAFLRVYERIAQFDDQRPFAPWFMRVVVNEALQAARHRQRQYSLDAAVLKDGDGADDSLTFADLLIDHTPQPDAGMEATELRETVKQALEALSPDQRAVIVLRYYLGMNETELSDELDIPAGTVKWRLHAARKHLRVLLRQFWQTTTVREA
ncbi:MAG TPA: sigma-70 family RNA polymerase sigma factor [Phototrophicaceae bacterium]|nr:sigma-70 family RNA polymerase sigma factor [Phototrophicaceae bacterium]